MGSFFSFLGAHLNDGYDRLTSLCSSSKRHPELQDFESKLAEKLDALKKAGEERGFVSIDWLVQALSVVVSTHANVQALIPKLTHEDDKWVREYLDDRAKLLVVCDVLERGIADVQVYPTSVQGAIRCLEGKDRSYYRAHKVLLDCTLGEGWRAAEPELECCMYMLCSMCKKVVKHEANGNGFFNVAISSARVITIVLCDLVVGALGSGCPLVRRYRLDLVHVTRQRLWAASLISIEHRGKEEINKRLTMSAGFMALLDELDTVDVLVLALVRRLHGVLDKKVESSIPLLYEHSAIEESLNNSEAEDLRCLASSLDARSKSLGRSLDSLDRSVNELYQLLDCRQRKCTSLHANPKHLKNRPV